jgi:hypothetical protein
LVYARCPAAPTSSAEDLEAVAIAGAVAAALLRSERTGGLQLVEWPIVGQIWADSKELESVNRDRDQGDEILAEVGFDRDSIADLRARGAVG